MINIGDKEDHFTGCMVEIDDAIRKYWADIWTPSKDNISTFQDITLDATPQHQPFKLPKITEANVALVIKNAKGTSGCDAWDPADLKKASPFYSELSSFFNTIIESRVTPDVFHSIDISLIPKIKQK